MKKSLLSRCSYLMAFLFLAVISPVFFSSDANAACIWQTTSATGSTQNGVCTQGQGPTMDPACSTYTTYEACTTATNVVAADTNRNAFVATMCNALKIITGNGGKAFAAFAIISLGVGFFTGKVSWGLMIGVAAGIAAMFGAPTIVAAISGGSAYDCGA